MKLNTKFFGGKQVQAQGTVHMAAVVAGLSLGQHGQTISLLCTNRLRNTVKCIYQMWEETMQDARDIRWEEPEVRSKPN